MNDGDVVVFRGQQNPGGALGIYRGSTLPLVQSGNATSLGTITIGLNRPVINNSGTVAFYGGISGGPIGVFKTADGVNLTYVGYGALAPGQDRISINNLGAVAFAGTGSPGNPVSGIFLGSDPVNDRVIGVNDPLDGSTVVGVYMWEEALNDQGQVAFWAHLADGRKGVYRATPQKLKALTFTAKVPGCGPINGTVSLLAKAPAGGMVVALASANPAATVPVSVLIPAGKVSATFKINTTPVTTNTAGAITATLGAQTLTRTLTVRPISVKSILLAPNPVQGGAAVTGTVTLDCAAAPAGITVNISSSKPAVALPQVGSLLFPAGGTTTQTFPIATTSVTATTYATIKSTANGITKSRKLTINP